MSVRAPIGHVGLGRFARILLDKLGGSYYAVFGCMCKIGNLAIELFWRQRHIATGRQGDDNSTPIMAPWSPFFSAWQACSLAVVQSHKCASGNSACSGRLVPDRRCIRQADVRWHVPARCSTDAGRSFWLDIFGQICYPYWVFMEGLLMGLSDSFGEFPRQ